MGNNNTISDLVKSITKDNNITVKDIANALGCTQQSYRNKLTRNSFSIKDLIIILNLCGVSLGIINERKDVEPIVLNAKDYLFEEEFNNLKKVKSTLIRNDVDKINELLSLLPDDEKNKIIDNIIEKTNKAKDQSE